MDLLAKKDGLKVEYVNGLGWKELLPEALRMLPSPVRRMSDAQAFANHLITQRAIDEDDAAVVVVGWDKQRRKLVSNFYL